jgi:hypothetical protein
MPPPPPRSSAAASKRPWYLVAALIAAWVFGAGSWVDGCNAAAFYKGATVDIAAAAQSLTDAQARDEVIALGTQWLDVWAGAKSRALPLGIASLLLGMTMALLAMRSMMGQAGARRALVQVVAVHAALLVVTYYLTADVRGAELAFQKALVIARFRDQRPDETTAAQVESMRVGARLLPPLQLGFRTVASVLILLVLTRPRVRALYETPAGTLPER